LSGKEWIKFTALGLIWGSSFLWIKIAVQEIGPFTLVTFRVLFALLGILAVVAYRRTGLPGRNWWMVFLILGLFNTAVPFVLISWAEQRIPSGVASIVNSTIPLFTILIAPLFLKDEAITPDRLFGLAGGFLGVIVLMSNQIEGGIGSYQFGLLAMLLAAILYAGSAVFARRKLKGLPIETQSLGQMIAAWLFITPLTAVVEAPLSPPEQSLTWMAIAWLGILGSCVGTLLYYSLINTVGPTRTTLVSYVFPLVGVLLGVLFLNEQPDWRLLVGGGLIIGGIVMVNRRKANGN
jgi:drug/metabolite transporter (DMT)-like permease